MYINRHRDLPLDMQTQVLESALLVLALSFVRTKNTLKSYFRSDCSEGSTLHAVSAAELNESGPTREALHMGRGVHSGNCVS